MTPQLTFLWALILAALTAPASSPDPAPQRRYRRRAGAAALARKAERRGLIRVTL